MDWDIEMDKIEEDKISITPSDCASLDSSCSSPAYSDPTTPNTENVGIKFERSVSASDAYNETNTAKLENALTSSFLRIYIDNSTTVVSLIILN